MRLRVAEAAIFLYLSYALPVIVLEFFFLKTRTNPSTGLDFKSSRKPDGRRVFVKLTGMAATLTCVALAYWIFPEYHGEFYREYWNFLLKIAPYFTAAVIPYFFIVDGMMKQPQDGYFQTGRLLLGDWKNIDWATVRQHFLGWAVKGFYLALMFTYFKNNVVNFPKMDLHGVFTNFKSFYDFAYFYLFMIDVIIASAGYLLTMRILDSHIRSTEPTTSGWLAALLCYQPFWGLLSAHYLPYAAKSAGWSQWLWGKPFYLYWGSAILLCVGFYVYATIAFGIRFSNLTHRGIITNGPYAWTKHPAYVGKNLSYWLVAIPWISTLGPLEAARSCCMLILLNLIYYWRARTEERHLSRDPVYVEYALAMNKKSIFAPLAGIFPFLKYKPPVRL